jgi:hypothetical protein
LAFFATPTVAETPCDWALFLNGSYASKSEWSQRHTRSGERGYPTIGIQKQSLVVFCRWHDNAAHVIAAIWANHVRRMSRAAFWTDFECFRPQTVMGAAFSRSGI